MANDDVGNQGRGCALLREEAQAAMIAQEERYALVRASFLDDRRFQGGVF